MQKKSANKLEQSNFLPDKPKNDCFGDAIVVL